MTQELSEYQKFRLEKLMRKSDDGHSSVNFSGSKSISNNGTDRDYHINTYRNPQKSLLQQNYHNLQSKYQKLLKQYEKLQGDFKIKEAQAKKYKELYLQKMEQDKQTKIKLKQWVQQAKKNLPDNLNSSR